MIRVEVRIIAQHDHDSGLNQFQVGFDCRLETSVTKSGCQSGRFARPSDDSVNQRWLSIVGRSALLNGDLDSDAVRIAIDTRQLPTRRAQTRKRVRV